MFKPSATRAPVTFDANPSVYHAKQKALRGTPEYIMSRSELEKFAACQRKWIKGIPNEYTNAMRWGYVVDVVTLTPKLVEKVFAITPKTYETKGMECPKCKSVTDSQKCSKCKVERVETTVTKDWNANSDTCREWIKKEEEAGRTVVNEELVSEAWKAFARMKEDEEIKAILDASKKQVMVNVDWHDPETGLVVPFKALIDLLPEPKSDQGDTIWDLKCCQDASQKKWQRQVFNDHLFYQGGCYILAVNAATGLKYRNFGHLLSESGPPYEPAHRLMTDEFLQLGINDFKSDMARYCRSLKTGVWRGYDSDPSDLETWMLKQG